MARSFRAYTRYDQAALAQVQYDPKLYSQPLRLLGLKGHDKTSALSRLPEGYARLVRDVTLRDNQYVSRDGTAALSTAAAAAIVHAQEIILSTGGSFPVRFTTAGVEVFQGGWTPATGAAWTTTDLRNFSMTGWNDSIVFADDTNGIFEMTFTGAFPITRLIFLAGVKHLATFAGRIIASLDNRIQWTIKNNQTDWAGIGSGYEDLKSAPGGSPDGQTAVVPLSDDTALMIRTRSVWLMRTTGDFDAPFAFTLLTRGKGCIWPRTVAATTGGAIWVGEDATIWMYDQNGINNIAQPIYKTLQVAQSVMRKTTAAYDPRYDEYRLAIPGLPVQRFNLSAQMWTEDTYQFPIRSLSYATYAQPLTVDQLVGTVDALGAIAVDDLGVGQKASKMMFAMADPQRYVVLEAGMLAGDINSAGAAANKTLEIQSGYARLADPLHRTETLQIITEYECLSNCTLDYFYSDDGGVTWIALTSVPIVVTSKAKQLTLDYSLDREDIQFKVSSANSNAVKFIDFFVMARQGGLKSDAN